MPLQEPYIARALMRIYQVLAPSQEYRGEMFGNMIALKEEWICVDDSYYNAPGMEQSVKDDRLCLHGSRTLSLKSTTQQLIYLVRLKAGSEENSQARS
jgi:hypothetical protein